MWEPVMKRMCRYKIVLAVASMVVADVFPRSHFSFTSNTGKLYWPEYSINTMGSMKPGQGYKIHMKEEASLIYP